MEKNMLNQMSKLKGKVIDLFIESELTFREKKPVENLVMKIFLT